MNKGKIIVAFGLPGSGKSSVTRAIGKKLGIKTLHELEESAWPAAVQNRKLSGNFTAIMWFRSIRVPQLYEAAMLRDAGVVSMIDSFYDKLFALYISAPGIEWLFRSNDPYFSDMHSISTKDYNLLPDADVLVFFRVDFDTWKNFITKRHRNLDQDAEFAKLCFSSQEAFLAAAKQYCKETNCKLFIYDQHVDTPEQAADKIIIDLKNSQLL